MRQASAEHSQEKQIFWVLHGMRGIAALFVSLMHLGVPYAGYQGYLGVDFFFVLSGFVICHAYDQELRQGLSPWRFLKRRMLRLYPVYFLGITSPLLLSMLYAVTYWPLWEAGNIWVCYGMNLLFLPAPQWADITAMDLLYPMNLVAWSLAFEVLVNIVYGFGHRLFEGRRLVFWVPLFGAVLVYSVYYYEMMDMGGFWGEWMGGVVRALWGIFVGVVLARRYMQLRPGAGSAWRLVPLSALWLMMTLVPAYYEQVWNLMWVLVGIPAMVWMAAPISLGRKANAFCRWLGDASYPMYMMHIPISSLLVWLYWEAGYDPDETFEINRYTWAVFALVMSSCIGKWYDAPLRRLAKKLAGS